MATAIKCSNCGANLSVAEGAANVVCTYCGATVDGAAVNTIGVW